MKLRILLALCFSLLGPASVAARAQSGPWADGEIVVRTTRPSDGIPVFYRIDPVSGHGEELVSGFFFAGYADGAAFDRHRGGLLANVSLPPDHWAAWKLWLIQSDGSGVHIPGFDGQSLRGICPVGDGRVYLQVNTQTTPNTIQYLDANNGIHTLMDASGSTPLDFAVEHMVYDAPSNALIATASYSGLGERCGSSIVSAIHRIPLSADGSKVAGPITCTDYATGQEGIIDVEHLPDGRLLVTISSTYLWDDKLLAVDPLTLAISTWAEVQPHDIDGGHWNSALGKALVLDDISNVLRAYGPGDSGLGTEIPTDVPVGDFTSGFTPAEQLFEIELGSPDGNYCRATVNSTGSPADIAFTGSTSISANDATLTAQPVPNKPFLFFFGPNQIQVPFGNGYLCVGGGVTRILPPSTASGNVATRTIDLVGLGISPGPMNFQCWFRDPAAGGAGFNTSDAIQVSFVP